MLSYSALEIRRKVNRIANKYGTTDPEQLCAELGVNLIKEPLGTDEDSIKGMMIVCSRIKNIMVNCDLPEVIVEFLIAHELGHAVLHPCHSTQFTDFGFFDDVSGKEKEANLFAAELLMHDSDELYKEMKYSELTLFQIAASHNVPYELLAYKLEIMKEQGYDVPELPYEPDYRFLAGSLGIENVCQNWGD